MMMDLTQPALTPDAIECLFAIAIGYAVAGLLASAWRLSGRPFPSLRQLEVGPTAARLAAVPLLVFCAPHVIMHRTLRQAEPVDRPPAQLVMIATIVAGLWSLMSGSVVMMALQALVV